MRAIVEYRKTVYGPVLSEYNVAGAGHNHIQDICHLWGSMRDHGYWSIVYNLSNPGYDKIILRAGVPCIQGAK